MTSCDSLHLFTTVSLVLLSAACFSFLLMTRCFGSDGKKLLFINLLIEHGITYFISKFLYVILSKTQSSIFNQIFFSNYFRLLATTSADQTAKIWSTADFSLVQELKQENQRWVWDVAFSADSQYMFTGELFVKQITMININIYLSFQLHLIILQNFGMLILVN